MNRWPWIVAVILAIVAVGQQVKMGQLKDNITSLEQDVIATKVASKQGKKLLNEATASAKTALAASKDDLAALKQTLEDAKSRLAASKTALDEKTAALEKSQAATSNALDKAKQSADTLQKNTAKASEVAQQLTTKDAELQKAKTALDEALAAEKLAVKTASENAHIAKATKAAVHPAPDGAFDVTPRWVAPVAGPLASPSSRAVCMECHTAG